MKRSLERFTQLGKIPIVSTSLKIKPSIFFDVSKKFYFTFPGTEQTNGWQLVQVSLVVELLSKVPDEIVLEASHS